MSLQAELLREFVPLLPYHEGIADVKWNIIPASYII